MLFSGIWYNKLKPDQLTFCCFTYFGFFIRSLGGFAFWNSRVVVVLFICVEKAQIFPRRQYVCMRLYFVWNPWKLLLRSRIRLLKCAKITTYIVGSPLFLSATWLKALHETNGITKTICLTDINYWNLPNFF